MKVSRSGAFTARPTFHAAASEHQDEPLQQDPMPLPAMAATPTCPHDAGIPQVHAACKRGAVPENGLQLVLKHACDKIRHNLGGEVRLRRAHNHNTTAVRERGAPGAGTGGALPA